MPKTRREFLEHVVAAAAVAGTTAVGTASAADAAPLPAGPPAVPYAMDELDAHDALGLATLVARRQVSPTELLERAVRRAAAIAPLNAIAVNDEAVGHAAVAAKPAGPFAGVPFLLKDLAVELAGTRTTNGSRFFAEQPVAAEDGELVRRFKAAGLVIFGKTTSPELGLSPSTESALHGATRNPWNPAHIAGGSSGGSAVAVAAGVVPMAHASDGGGSIRIPASCCGLFGLKPSRGRVPFPNHKFDGWGGLSTHFAVTRSVRDAAALLDAVAGPAPGATAPDRPAPGTFLAAAHARPDKLRIAVLRHPLNGGPVDPECATALENTVKLCARLGHDIVDARPAIDMTAWQSAFGMLVAVGIARSLEDRARVLGRACTETDVEPMTWLIAQSAKGISGAAYAAALEARDAVAAQMADFHRDHDLLLSPTLAEPPPELGRLVLSADPAIFSATATRFSPYTSLANLTGQPAMSLPLHRTASGLPVGLMFQGRFGEEARMLSLAAQLERARAEG